MITNGVIRRQPGHRLTPPCARAVGHQAWHLNLRQVLAQKILIRHGYIRYALKAPFNTNGSTAFKTNRWSAWRNHNCPPGRTRAVRGRADVDVPDQGRTKGPPRLPSPPTTGPPTVMALLPAPPCSPVLAFKVPMAICFPPSGQRMSMSCKYSRSADNFAAIRKHPFIDDLSRLSVVRLDSFPRRTVDRQPDLKSL